MDTVLNLGMNDTVLHQLSSCTGNPKFAYDTYRRFLQMYGSVVLGVDKDRYQVCVLNVYCYPCRLPYLPPFPMIGGYFTFAELSFLFLLISLCFLR